MSALIEVKVSKKKTGVQWRHWSKCQAYPWIPLEGEKLEINLNGFIVSLEDGSIWRNKSTLAVVKVDHENKRLHSGTLNEPGTYLVGRYEIKRKR